MEAQRGACEAVIASKDALIAGAGGGGGQAREWVPSHRLAHKRTLCERCGGRACWPPTTPPLRRPCPTNPRPAPPELRGALRGKDDEYVRLLKRQAGEVDALLVRGVTGW